MARVLIEAGQVKGIEMEDGEIAEAPIIAMAVGTSRMRALLDPLPAELEAPLAYSDQLGHREA